MLEGDRYTRILADDYISHLRCLQQDHDNNVQAALRTNSQITNWVQQSVLGYDSLTKRNDVFQFFVLTAEVIFKFMCVTWADC